MTVVFYSISKHLFSLQTPVHPSESYRSDDLLVLYNQTAVGASSSMISHCLLVVSHHSLHNQKSL